MPELRISLEKSEHIRLLKAKGNMTWKEYLMRDIKRGEITYGKDKESQSGVLG